MTRIAAALLSLLVATSAAAHPGSGIVANRDGQIYFLDTGAGIWKLGAGGALTRVAGPAFHWMTIDPDNRFAKTGMPSGSGWEIAKAGDSPTFLVASDFPLTVGADGNLYYPKPGGRAAVEIVKLTPAGATTVLATLPVPWVNGLASGPGGSLYVTEDRAIRRIGRNGRVSTIVENLAVAGCAAIPEIEAEENGPYLRGLDVDAQGTVVVAAAGCGTVLKVTPEGKVSSLLQLQAPWSPTAVVRVGGDLYVLEYLHAAGEDRRVWVPRVRKIAPDGKSAIVATVERH